MGYWLKLVFFAGGFGLALGLLHVILLAFGINDEKAIWIRSIALVLGAVGIVINQIYQATHAKEQEEKLQTAMYEALGNGKDSVAGSKILSRSDSDDDKLNSAS